MKIAIVGGGYAGMAAAVTLADAGVAVTVYEAGPHLGGRARRVVVNGVALDNGLHILIGAYRETLALVAKVHAEPARALARLPLDWRIHGRFRLKAAPLPTPLHLAVGLLNARGAPWRERFAAARFMKSLRAQRYTLPYDMSVRELLVNGRQGPFFTRYLWEPLCIAALNTPPQVASAQVFLNVLRDGLDAERAAGDILLARVDLTALFPEPAGNYVSARGGTVHTGRTVDALQAQDARVTVRTRDGEAAYDHAICAVSPHRAATLLSDLPQMAQTIAMLESFRYQPIHSVYLQFTQPVRLPAPMLGFEGTAQWLFDRDAICAQSGLVAAVISASGPHEDLTQDALAHRVHEELDREFGPLPPLAWHRVIAEKRATFECSVGLERPSSRTALTHVHLAGDYTASGYPATLEAAVRSGIAAAHQVLGQSAKL